MSNAVGFKFKQAILIKLLNLKQKCFFQVRIELKKVLPKLCYALSFFHSGNFMIRHFIHVRHSFALRNSTPNGQFDALFFILQALIGNWDGLHNCTSVCLQHFKKPQKSELSFKPNNDKSF